MSNFVQNVDLRVGKGNRFVSGISKSACCLSRILFVLLVQIRSAKKSSVFVFRAPRYSYISFNSQLECTVPKYCIVLV